MGGDGLSPATATAPTTEDMLCRVTPPATSQKTRHSVSHSASGVANYPQRTRSRTLVCCVSPCSLYCYTFTLYTGHLPHRHDSGRQRRTRGQQRRNLLPGRPNSSWSYRVRCCCCCSPCHRHFHWPRRPASAPEDRIRRGTQRPRRESFGIATPPLGMGG